MRARSASLLKPGKKTDTWPVNDVAKSKSIALDGIDVVAIPPQLITNPLKSLGELFILNTSIRVLPDELFSVLALKKLVLVNNPVIELPRAAVLTNKSLKSLELSECPIGYPPKTVWSRGLKAIRSFLNKHPAWVCYRLDNGDGTYVDVDHCGVQDQMVKSKDEDRMIAIYGRPDGSHVVIPAIDRAKKELGVGVVQKGPGWTSRDPDPPLVSHVIPIRYMFVGVFDGHAGSWVADALQQNMHKKFKEAGLLQDLEEPLDYAAVIEKVYLDVDESIKNKIQGRSDGSTAVISIIKRGAQLITSHVGDSRCISIQGKKSVDITVDHDPLSAEERERVEARGAHVQFAKGALRLTTPGNKGDISVTRAFGDLDWKQGGRHGAILEARPDVSVHTMGADWSSLVVASDGVWHLMESRECAKVCQRNTLVAQQCALAILGDVDGNTQAQLKGHDNAALHVCHLEFGAMKPQWNLE